MSPKFQRTDGTAIRNVLGIRNATSTHFHILVSYLCFASLPHFSATPFPKKVKNTFKIYYSVYGTTLRTMHLLRNTRSGVCRDD
jgi:hypothetical protein